MPILPNVITPEIIWQHKVWGEALGLRLSHDKSLCTAFNLSTVGDWSKKGAFSLMERQLSIAVRNTIFSL